MPPYGARMRLLALAPLALALLLLPAAMPLAHADLADKALPAWGPNTSASVIRPGAEARTAEGYCTYNFLFYDNSNAYIGTAAHCTDKIGEVASLGNGTRIGTVVYDSDRTAGADSAVDFALIKLDANRIAWAHPQMIAHNGPTGIANRTDLPLGEELSIYGYGLLFGETSPTRARDGVLVSTTIKLYRADMPAVNGDSGGPILETDTGKAVGIISHYGFTSATTDEGPLMTFVMAELQKAGYNVTLATI